MRAKLGCTVVLPDDTTQAAFALWLRRHEGARPHLRHRTPRPQSCLNAHFADEVARWHTDEAQLCKCRAASQKIVRRCDRALATTKTPLRPQVGADVCYRAQTRVNGSGRRAQLVDNVATVGESAVDHICVTVVCVSSHSSSMTLPMKLSVGLLIEHKSRSATVQFTARLETWSSRQRRLPPPRAAVTQTAVSRRPLLGSMSDLAKQ